MRAGLIALPVVLLAACGTEEPSVPLLHMNADSLETVREAAQAIERAGVPVKVVAIGDMAKDEIPEWLSSVAEGWVLLGKAEDRQRAEQALEAWYEELRTRSKPPPPAIEPLVLGARAPAADEVDAIRAELARRRALDQEVRRDARRHGEMEAVDADNTAYLRKLVTDVGWIDAARFGRPAADAAFLVVQHSSDLPLMLAALPAIEKDVRAGGADAQNYALLYDRTQLVTGGKQRFGTQVQEMEGGELVVRRLEDPDRVDEFRESLGLGPLRTYLAGFGREVRIER
jgi:hypothetical protein